ncbi:hypothetical protein [Piscinibacter sp.]|uniref:hypothetical protein n=1 Tax=Piscinibacter sp. TaxID=1903157 RepID=UPI001D3EE9A3|nr:hypothetical protein [Piscinibacter sp.]MBK7532928.1 hypothetical protein [Piscinibacter sp.]
MAAAPQANLRPRLFIDGISAGNDGALVGVEMSEGGTVNLRFHVATDKTTRNLWAAMYRDRPMTSPAPLRASLGWDSVPNTFPADASSPSAPTIQVTTPLREYVAFGAIAILGAFFLWCLRGSDVFRDHPSQPQPPTLSRNGSKPRARVVRATYSLARVQTGLWLFFIVAAGLFMWLVLGELPAAEPTLVGLLGLSAVTTSVSIAVDGNAGGRPFKPSERFLTDLVTGWDGTQQLHRIQALVVNGLLLVVGLEAVVQNLSYPIFDGTWLALLGVSAVAQTMGKQALESNLKLGSAANPGSGGTQGAPAAVPAGRKV